MTPRIVSVHGVKTPAKVPKRGPPPAVAADFPFFPVGPFFAVGDVDVAAACSSRARPPSAARPERQSYARSPRLPRPSVRA